MEIGAIDRGLEDLADINLNRPEFEPQLQAEFDEAYARDPEPFLSAMEETRDLLSGLMVETWRGMLPADLSYQRFRRNHACRQ